MARQPIFGADDLRHPDHEGSNPFADDVLSGQADCDCVENPMGCTAHASDYAPTGAYTPALAGRGKRLMWMASSGTLFAIACLVGALLSDPFNFSFFSFNFFRFLFAMATFLNIALTLPAVIMSTLDLRAMRAGAMDPADQRRTIAARRIAVVGLLMSVIAGAWIVRIIVEVLVSV